MKYEEAVKILVAQRLGHTRDRYLGLSEEEWKVIVASFEGHLNQAPHVPMAEPDFSLEEIEEGQEVIDNLK